MPTHMTDATLEALRSALGQVISQQRKHWDQQREVMDAQTRATIAEFKAIVGDLQAKVDRAILGIRNGEPGSIGPAGVQGPPGERGLQGPAGLPGERGEPGQDGGTGPAGVPGERGIQGLAGERGPHGDQGAPGLSVKGDRGERGERGEKGDQGLPGLSVKGDRGERGETGDRGERGLPGEIGKAGDRGEPGSIGEPGKPGERGERGPAGMLPIVKAWQAGVHYEGEVVTRAGGTYQALEDTADQPGESKAWACLARPGVDGRMPAVRGLFKEGETYVHLDMVALGGSTFVAKSDNPGPCPGAGWQLLVSQGKAGPKGERGMSGERGERGLPGTPAATIIDWAIDRENFAAVPIMSDGREGKALPLRPLFEQFQIEAR